MGDVKTGTVIFSGAVGELKAFEALGLKDYIQYPEKMDFMLSMNNILDKDNEFAGRKCGFFVPESWSYFGMTMIQNQNFMDNHSLMNMVIHL